MHGTCIPCCSIQIIRFSHGKGVSFLKWTGLNFANSTVLSDSNFYFYFYLQFNIELRYLLKQNKTAADFGNCVHFCMCESVPISKSTELLVKFKMNGFVF